MAKRLLTFALVGFFVCAGFVHAEMSSATYKIRWDTLSTGGSDTATSASYQLRDTVESIGGGKSSSGSYIVAQGYRQGVFDEIITFDVHVQDLSDERSATNLAGTTITMSTSGISTGDYIALVQDKGSSQVSAVGKVTSTGAGTVTLDALSGGSPVIDGTNDYAYQLDASSISFGDLSASTVSTAIISFELSVENDNGYIVQLVEDGNLRDGANTIADVSDGAVTAGSTEYGARSSDATLASSTFDTTDTAITSALQDIATESSARFEDRNFITLKASIADGASDGSYAQTLSFIASGNF